MCYMPCIAYLDRILACRTADLGAFVPWSAAGTVVGRVHRQRTAQLAPTFALQAGGWSLVGEDFAERTARLDELVRQLAARGEIRPLTAEPYPVPPHSASPLLQIDRAAVPWFGVGSAGVHLNGYLRRGDGLHLWLAERSRSKATFPGHLDNLVAGGQSIAHTALQTLIKECGEEAGMAAELASRAQPTSTIRYVQQDCLGLKADTLQCFDLQLPEDFAPRAVDGEVETFHLWPVADVAASLRGDDLWKPNSALVALDFLLRHGALDHELAPAERARLWRNLHGELA